MLLVLGVMFLGSMQPVMMVVSLIFITLLYAMYMYMYVMSFWYSYALMMVMLSGVFVVFVYMASLNPNEEFEIYSVIAFVLLLFVYMIRLESLLGDVCTEFICASLWISYLGLFITFLVMMLLSVMLMVIWLSNNNKGALRVF